MLISQITTNYGGGFFFLTSTASLNWRNCCEPWGEVEVPWIRMHYAYPTGLTAEVIQAIRETPNVLPYLDLPLQHSHPEDFAGP